MAPGGDSRHIPVATYRLQFGRSFGFRHALDLVPYLHDLGIGAAYASPVLKSRPGSHGYDVVDHTQLNPELGSEDDFTAFAGALRERGMGFVLDMVPNHMGIDAPDNAWWLDVLENGPSSTYAAYFDVQWQPAKPELANRVLLPVLGDQYGQVLERGQLRLAYEEGAFVLYYFDHKLPVAPRTYSQILTVTLDRLVRALGDEHEQVVELQSILTALGYLPPRTETDPARLAERQREKEVIKRRIGALYDAASETRAAFEETLREINGTPGDAGSFDRLDALIEAQTARPSYWRVAAEEINYRRFFDVNELAAIRVELPEVFAATHDFTLRLLAEGHATGLRIDHPDGLWDPAGYFQALQAASPDGAPAAALPLYVVAEKILAPGEDLPDDWAVHGTTGYDFLNDVNGLFVDATARRAFDRLYQRFTGTARDFRELAHASKLLIMRISLASEINMLSYELERLAERNRHYRDFTLNGLTSAIRAVIAALPVYRTYVNALTGRVSPRDSAVVEATIAEAKRRAPQTDPSVFDFLRDTWLQRNADRFAEPDRAALAQWVMKFQQMTGPVMAKGVEDTAFYIYNRLISLNEVGGHPDRFGVPVADFHDCNAERRERRPHTLLATSTHDAKRGEDVRARISVLSEMPDDWRRALARWSRMNARKKTAVDGRLAPDRNDEYLLYQTLIGAWPEEPHAPGEVAEFRERVAAYMHKATKEAKVHTGWLSAHAGYDAAVETFINQVLDPAGNRRFLADLQALQRHVAYFGRFNGLAQTLLKTAAPGVPDVYHGSELWDLNLVDPDNRRPVDYARRRELLAHLDGAAPGPDLARELVEAAPDGRIKLYVLSRALRFRREHAALFADGDYRPLEVGGEQREHVVAFARALDGVAAVVVVPRLTLRLVEGSERPPLGAEVWGATHVVLPREWAGRAWRDVFTGAAPFAAEYDGAPALPLAAVLADFPVALLKGE